MRAECIRKIIFLDFFKSWRHPNGGKALKYIGIDRYFISQISQPKRDCLDEETKSVKHKCPSRYLLLRFKKYFFYLEQNPPASGTGGGVDGFESGAQASFVRTTMKL